jgi:hypothetical protein
MMHTAKKKERNGKQILCRDDETRKRSTLTTTIDSTRTTKDILQKQRLQEGNNAQALLSPDQRSWFSP